MRIWSLKSAFWVENNGTGLTIYQFHPVVVVTDPSGYHHCFFFSCILVTLQKKRTSFHSREQKNLKNCQNAHSWAPYAQSGPVASQISSHSPLRLLSLNSSA